MIEIFLLELTQEFTEYFSIVVNLVKHTDSVAASVTRWLNNLFHIWPFSTMKMCPLVAKVGSKFCKMQNKPSRNSQKLLNFCQICKILPNLITLVAVTAITFPKYFLKVYFGQNGSVQGAIPTRQRFIFEIQYSLSWVFIYHFFYQSS